MRTARVRAVAQSWLPLCLAALCAPVFAQPPCPSSLAGMIALGTGSCTVSGLGTVSNFRFSTSTTNGGASWNTASSSSGLGPGYVILAFGTGSAAGVGPSDSTSTFNLAFNLVPPAGNTLTGASYSLGYSFGASPAPSFSGAESLCLNGVFTGFRPQVAKRRSGIALDGRNHFEKAIIVLRMLCLTDWLGTCNHGNDLLREKDRPLRGGRVENTTAPRRARLN